jgi:dTDP-4-amino-4,6-dideoxygalactose transaminase
MLKFPYSKPEIIQLDIDAVVDTLKTGYLTQGEKLEKFEFELKNVFKSKNAIVCNSGTAALHLLYNALGLGPKIGLLTSPITFLATANAARMCNAPVIFADTDSKTGLLTPETVEHALMNSKIKIKVITLVHLGGKVCDLEGIAKVAKKYDCYLVEDSCHAPGPKYFNNGKEDIIQNNCKYSIACTYSFHAIKHIAMGEGGCVTTNDERIAKIIKEKRSHGIKRLQKEMKFLPEKNAKWYYEMHELGWNYRADELSCALGLSQLKRLGLNIEKRKKLVELYYSFLTENKYITLPLKLYNNYINLWHLFSIEIDFERLGKSRGMVMDELEKLGIGTQVHYIPLFLQPYYREKQLITLSGAMEYYQSTLSIPLYTELNKKDIIYISSKINDVISL